MRYRDGKNKIVAAAVMATQRAIAAAGGQSALARACGVTPQSVQGWLKNGGVPAERVVKVEKATGVSRAQLRPDLYAGMGDDSTHKAL